jgi:hypothetical protein
MDAMQSLRGKAMKRWKFQFEPAVWLGLVRAIVPLLLLFGVINWTSEQMAQFFVTTEVVLTFVQRSFVTPNASLTPATVAEAKLSPPGPPAGDT